MATQTKTGRKNRTKDQQTEKVAASLSQNTLLGEIITFGSKSGSTHKHADVVQALKDAGLDEKAAKEFLPGQAFARAAKKLSDERVIDVVNEWGDDVVFQFTKKFFKGRDESEGGDYRKEVYLTLDKILYG